MKIYLDTKANPARVLVPVEGALSSGVTLKKELRTLTVKRGTSLQVELILPGGYGDLQLGVKRRGKYDEELVLWSMASMGNALDDGMQSWHLNMEINSTALDEDLGVGAAADKASVAYMAEFVCYEMLGEVTKSATIEFVVQNDIVRGEGPPPEVARWPKPDEVVDKEFLEERLAEFTPGGGGIRTGWHCIEVDGQSGNAGTVFAIVAPAGYRRSVGEYVYLGSAISCSWSDDCFVDAQGNTLVQTLIPGTTVNIPIGGTDLYEVTCRVSGVVGGDRSNLPAAYVNFNTEQFELCRIYFPIEEGEEDAEFMSLVSSPEKMEALRVAVVERAGRAVDKGIGEDEYV